MEEYTFANSISLEFPVHVKMSVHEIEDAMQACSQPPVVASKDTITRRHTLPFYKTRS